MHNRVWNSNNSREEEGGYGDQAGHEARGARGWMKVGTYSSHRSGEGLWNRRLIVRACMVLCCIGSFTLLVSTIWPRWAGHGSAAEMAELIADTHVAAPAVEDVEVYDASTVLNGPPTDKFRDNLLQDKKYITTFLSAGWTNDVMTYINLIYLGKITERIPIIGSFIPTHIGSTVPPIPFNEVFDVPRLRRELKMPVLEWNEVKKNSSLEYDELGCWNTWEASQPREAFPRSSRQPDMLGLDISYTKAPTWIKIIPDNAQQLWISFWGLAMLAFPEGIRDFSVEPAESPRMKLKLPVDEQLMCYDYLYYAGAQVPFEYDNDFSPAWRFVGKHLHWTPRIADLGDQYVRRTLGVTDGEKTPAFIAIHIRHGDFKNVCRDIPLSDCFAPLSAVSRRVEEVKKELLDKKGIYVEHVIMTSDEKDPKWWEEVKERGWYTVDHSQTVEQHGSWYPVLIDAVIQSGGMGFVGTDQSTMSVLARRRVESWRDGAVRTVKWGKPGADDH